MRTTPHRPLSLIAVLALALGAGCQSDKQRGETFDEGDRPSPIGRVAEAQAAAGAKQDATLYDRHFRGGHLDSLGTTKLALMVKGTAVGEPVQVYLDMPESTVAARRAAVTAYLAAAGVPADKVELAVGPNPNTLTPTAYNLSTVYKTDTGEAADLGVTGGLGANGPGGTVGK